MISDFSALFVKLGLIVKLVCGQTAYSLIAISGQCHFLRETLGPFLKTVLIVKSFGPCHL